MLLDDIQDAKDRESYCHFPLQFGNMGAVRAFAAPLGPNLSAYEPFIQQILTGHLLCANHSSVSWESTANKTNLWPPGRHSVGGDEAVRKINKNVNSMLVSARERK